MDHCHPTSSLGSVTLLADDAEDYLSTGELWEADAVLSADEATTDTGEEPTDG